ncbi:integrase, catalytic region, zinc finger, CCHC-type containing protein, partial [Tanacetum coccineum]
KYTICLGEVYHLLGRSIHFAWEKYTLCLGEVYTLLGRSIPFAWEKYTLCLGEVYTLLGRSIPFAGRSIPFAWEKYTICLVIASLRFPSTNDQLRTSSNLRNQATIHDGRVTVQQVQRRQGQSYDGSGCMGNATSFEGNNAEGQARVVKCYNCQDEGHMARQCTQCHNP